MKLYNTLKREVEDLAPLNPPKVTVYTCGPTVYDYPHAGNWFTFVRYDLMVRTLKASGLEPEWVMNITDVGHLVSDADEGEDKLEKGARREGKSAWDVAEHYTTYFIEGMKRLNISTPTHLPKATDHIQEQIELVQKLEEKGFTYRINDGIYYDTSKFPRYADFAQLDLDEQQAGARVEHNPEKHNPTDFALWKFSPEDRQRDMEWDSPWGKGFPGWHLECSAMSMKYLGETMDVHAGGIDHLPVHHTNEIAQSEAVTGKPLAKYWMHTNHITVNGEKISKSLGNGITLEDIEAKGFSLQAFRLHVLESHYRSQSKFSWESLEAAENRLKSLLAFADLRHQLVEDNGATVDFDFGSAKDLIKEALESDLSTPQALVALGAAEQFVGTNLQGEQKTDDFEDFLQYVDDVFGLELSRSEDISEDAKQLIAQRQEARQAQDWAASDAIRSKLAELHIAVRDTAHGPIWYRI
jgi:cysteinyl-tRNA synthetase